MFDIFKKLDEDQNNGELNTLEPCENVEEKITVEENINEETPNEELTTQEPYQTQEESILSILQSLGEEEQMLLLERSQLANMEETLAQKAREEVEFKRHRIENLRHEIPELKQRCEALAKALDMPIQK
jgi:predicted RNase H-like nuclease (RuvC/YqgF family)